MDKHGINKLFFMLLLCYCSLEATMKLVSPAFSHNEAIPPQYTCDGANISPALAWSNAPEFTQSFALIVDDPDVSEEALRKSSEALCERGAKSDAPLKVWVHWVVFNIPSTVNHINENQGALSEEAPFMYGSTDFNGSQKWGGPCPPNGTHHYHFSLYALDTMLDLPAGASKQQVLDAMHGHIIEQTTLIGNYQRKK